MWRLLVISWVLAGSAAQAGGFLVYEHGAVATGMADARTALADDLSALYFNPAAISELPGLELELGITGFLPYVSYRAAGEPPERFYAGRDEHGELAQLPVNDGQNDADAKLRGFTPFHLYASYNLERQGIALGLGVFSPFGLGTYWPGGWDGRFLTTESELATFFVQPVVALELSRLCGFRDRLRLSLAAGYDFVYGQALLTNRVDLRFFEAFYPDVRGAEGEARLRGDGVAHGFNLALYAEWPGQLAFGISLRSGMELPIEGPARFSFNAAGERVRERMLSDIPGETRARLSLPLPWQLNLGLAYLGIERLKLAADLFFAFFQTFDEISVTFACQEDTERPCPSLAQPPQKKNYHTSWQWSLGAEYRVLERFFARAGFAMSMSPVPAETLSPDLPDGTQKNISLGAGYRGDGLKLDLGYMLGLWSVDKRNDVGGFDTVGNPQGKANGTYSTVAHILALSVSLGF
ncbi:MAG: hypothetical protein GYA21_10295 [Myxococcales bacterium]|nr:hypothetical protein [Myxococcales bacterium]